MHPLQHIYIRSSTNLTRNDIHFPYVYCSLGTIITKLVHSFAACILHSIAVKCLIIVSFSNKVFLKIKSLKKKKKKKKNNNNNNSGRVHNSLTVAQY